MNIFFAMSAVIVETTFAVRSFGYLSTATKMSLFNSPGRGPQSLVELPYLVQLPVPLGKKAIIQFHLLKFYLALCIVGISEWTIVWCMWGTRYFRTSRAVPQLLDVLNVSCLEWFDAIAVGL